MVILQCVHATSHHILQFNTMLYVNYYFISVKLEKLKESKKAFTPFHQWGTNILKN